MLELETLITWPHLQHNLSHIKKILLLTSWAKIMTSEPLFQTNFILRRSKISNFAGIINIATMFIKTTFKNLKKLK